MRSSSSLTSCQQPLRESDERQILSWNSFFILPKFTRLAFHLAATLIADAESLNKLSMRFHQTGELVEMRFSVLSCCCSFYRNRL